MIYTKQKEGKITDLQARIKNHFAICFVHKIKNISLSGWPLVTQKVMDSITGCPIFANLVSKYP